MLIGHIGIALLQHRYLDAELVPVMAGGLFPDALDKTLCQGLRVTPSGRMWGHTTLGIVASTMLVGVLAGRRAARDWLLGYLGHLLADSEGPVPWWYPFKTYTFEQSAGFAEIFRHFVENQTDVMLEFALLTLGLLALATKRS
ncbi:MAG: metal-dependent hydrolase [Anaerolineae bacterium]|nr:metal-dependent hydrolase [Anaerolineae bacterium]